MANESLAVSARHRNSILGIASSKSSNLSTKCSSFDVFTPYSLNELNTLMGLAFTAILSEEKHIDSSAAQLNIFIKNRDTVNHPLFKNDVIPAITTLLKCGFSAFKTLGYPHYYDDFIWAYHRILSSHHHNAISPELKYEMRRILSKKLCKNAN